MEMKRAFGGFVTDAAKVSNIGGVETGVIAGYMASFSLEPNAYPDQFLKGAFLDSINSHKARSNRPVRLNYMHKRDPIGGFPIATVFEDTRGLFGEGHIALTDEKARSIYERAKAGFLSDFSIGYRSDPNATRFETLEDGREVRYMGKAEILEASIVDEPMNPDAQITAVKAEDILTIESLKGMTERELESFLAESGLFSRKAVGAVVAACKSLTRQPEEPEVLSRVMKSLTEIRESIGSNA